MKKRFLSVMLMLCMAISLMPMSTMASGMQSREDAGGSAASTWFRDQLDADAQNFYRAFETLAKDPAFTAGTASVDLVTGDYIGASALEAYANGNPALAKAFQDARDAFFNDHPAFFYIDTTKLTFRVGQTGGSYKAYISNGPNLNYLDSHFADQQAVADAISATDNAKAAIVKEINEQKNSVEVGSGDAAQGALSTAEIVTLVHNKLVNMFEYRYPIDATDLVTGVYSLASSSHQANCQGYAKSFKWIMDELGVPCVLVSGAGQNSNDVIESHMWNYVYVDGNWYAVDVTWDDPISSSRALRYTYLLQGSSFMDANHAPIGIFSPGGRTFDYPTLSNLSYDVSISSEMNDIDSDLKIYTQKAIDPDGDEYTEYMITYRGMSLNEMKAEGLHLAGRFAYEKKGVLEKFQPWVDMSNYKSDSGADEKIITFALFRPGSIQFCITKKEAGTNRLCYQEDLSLEGNHVTLSKAIQIPYYSDYVSPPFVRKANPPFTSRILPVKTHYTIEYDQALVLEDPNAPIGIDIRAISDFTGEETNDVTASIENLTMTAGSYTTPDGKQHVSTIFSFDFIPDKTYQGYSVYYTLKPTNLKGQESLKEPNEFAIATTFEMRRPCPILVAQGYNDAFVLAYPTLIANDNVDVFTYEGSGDKVSAMDIRLVATIPDQAQTDDMLGALPEDLEVLSSAVYDLVLGCKEILAGLRPGSGLYDVTVGIPYPEGFNYTLNKDVTFKAYHYTKKDDGTYETKEIPCRITELGLQIIVDGFSPFSVVAMPNADDSSTHKFVSVDVKTGGGRVTTTGTDATNTESVGAGGLYAVQDGETIAFTLQADEGYEIDRVVLNGEELTFEPEPNAIENDNELAGEPEAEEPEAEASDPDATENGNESTGEPEAEEPEAEEPDPDATESGNEPTGEPEAEEPEAEASDPDAVENDTELTDEPAPTALEPDTMESANESKTVTFEHTSMKDDNELSVYFIATEVKVEEKKQNFAAVTPVFTPVVLESIDVSLETAEGSIDLSAPSGNGTYYYKTTLSNDAARKPSVGDAVSSQWIQFNGNVSIPTVDDSEIFVQVVRAGSDGITAWGQSSATPMDALDTLSPSVTAGSGKLTLVSPVTSNATYYYKTTASSGSAPALNSAVDTNEWHALTSGINKEIAWDGTALYVQLLKAQNGKIKAWGQTAVPAADPSVLGTLQPALTAGDGKITLAPMSAPESSFYYKTTSLDDSANKPVAGADLPASGWTVMSTADIAITAPNDVVLFVQVIQTDSKGKIIAWGQSSATPKATPSSGGGSGGSGGGSSGGGGGSSSGSSSSTVKPSTPAPESNVTLNATATVSGDEASLALKDAEIEAAIKQLEKADSKQPRSISVKIDLSSAKSLSVELPATIQEALLKSNVQNFSLESKLLNLRFDAQALKSLNTQADDAVTLRIRPETLDSPYVNGRPAFQITAASGDKAISSFGDGTVTISLPYAASAGETAAQICGIYADESGAIQWLPFSFYDASNKRLQLATNHFSSYAVGLRNDLTFTDVSGHWAQDGIHFATARNIFSGMGNGKFSPDSNVTRGMFVTVLGRLSNVDGSKYTAQSFRDVASGQYYAPYVEWAMSEGIVSGTGEGRFLPDQPINRQEMAKIFFGYVKNTNGAVAGEQAGATYSDAASISSWAQESVRFMQNAGLMSGKSGNLFDPIGTATRAETAVILQRYITMQVG